MHYLQCNNCGHFNEVKTEFLIFCSHCNKKLDNNFSDWHKRNQHKTLDDFKQQFSTTEKADVEKPVKSQKKVKGL